MIPISNRKEIFSATYLGLQSQSPAMILIFYRKEIIIDPGPLNITFRSDMPITFLHLMLMSKIYLVNSDMKNVIGMSDTNVMFKGPGPFEIPTGKHAE